MKSTQTIRQKTGTIRSLCLLIAVFAIAVILIPVSRNAATSRLRGGTLLSPGLSVLAEQHTMAMAGIVGESIQFEAADFARAMNRSEVDSIVITSLPPVTDGELRVGNTVLTQGQTVSGSGLSLLTYTAASDITTSSFRFRVGDSPVEMTCKLYLLEIPNACPTLSVKTGSTSALRTYEGTVLYGTLPCYDPEGDETRIEIVSYPRSGSLVLTDAASGKYTYLAAADAEGKDSFTYVARDRYGNYSASATVELEIIKPGSSVVYADLKNSPYANDAMTVTDAGIMNGEQVGSATYFRPDAAVSRAEFTKMAMCALGMTEVSYSETVFTDNAEIPAELRGYVATAHELGYLRGIGEGNTLRFEPNRAITRAEAAVLLGGMLDLATPTVAPSFSDGGEIPAWAKASIDSLHAVGILQSGEDGAILSMAEVTRGDAAGILSRLMATVR